MGEDCSCGVTAQECAVRVVDGGGRWMAVVVRIGR
jgi:hypothetical protein